MAHPSPNFGQRRDGAKPSLVVLHYTAMGSCAEARSRLCDPAHEVSAHWLISETGDAEVLVPEEARAWHAGAGGWAGLVDINSHSIGIELANTGSHPFPAAQMRALADLLHGIFARWNIGPEGVIAHSDMAPTRKSDPGPRFDWRGLARQGLALWPECEGCQDRPLAASLAEIGYPEAPLPALLAAFRLRFAPWLDGPETATDRAFADAAAQVFRARRAAQGAGRAAITP